MRIAIVVADDRPSAAQRAASEHSRLLRAAGHAVERVVAREERGGSFVGQTHWPDGMVGVAQARRVDYDVTLATSWRAFFAMFALPARGRASLILADERRRMAPGDPLRALVERSLREPGITRVVGRAGLGVDRTKFHPGERSRRRRPRVLVLDGQPATGVDGVDVWRPGVVPLDAMPAVLRSCDALLDADDGGSGLAALEMQACGGSVIRRIGGPPEKPAGEIPGWEEGNRLLLAALEEAGEVPGWRRAELAAVHELLARVEQAPGKRSLVEQAVGVLRPWVRRALRLRPPLASSGRTTLSESGSFSVRGSHQTLRPGEPVLFVGQGTYFRSVWHDAVRDGWGVALPLPPSETARAGLPEAVARTGARTCVLFQPQLTPPTVARELRARGVRLVAYSSEPIPHDGVAAPHWDQVRRLDELRPARRIEWDLFLHYDPVSLGVLAEEGFHAPRAQPLPVSEELFFPEPVEPDLDVVFLGWSTPHREAFLARLEARFRVAHVARGLFDEDARRLMNRARVVVNLHVHAYPSFENRCVQALFCGRPLVSEPLSNRFLEPGVDFLAGSTPEELVDAVAEILRHGPPASRFDRARFRAAALRDLLSP